MAEKTVTWSVESTNKWSSKKYNSPREIILAKTSGTLPTTSSRIKSVNYSIWVSAPYGNPNYNWNIHYLAIGTSANGSPAETTIDKKIPMSDADGDGKYIDATITGSMTFAQSDINKFLSNSLTLYACIYHEYTAYIDKNTEYDGPVSITLTYEDGNVHYGNSTWKNCEVFYGVNGDWKPCTVYFGKDGTWKQV